MDGIFEKKAYFQLDCITVKGFRGYLPMFHPHGELIYVMEGSLPVTVDGVSHRVSAGEVAVVFPYLTHSYESAPDSNAIIILFDPASTAFDNTLLSQKPEQFYTDGSAFYPLLSRAVTMDRAGKIKTAMAYLNAVLGELLELLPLEPRDSGAGDITVQLLSYCADHFAEDITVKSIADALYISQSYVSKVFSQKLKCSFRAYINTLRIHRAQTLLKDTDKKILQIMSECGFRNQSSFNRTFLQITGTSPKAYRTATR